MKYNYNYHHKTRLFSLTNIFDAGSQPPGQNSHNITLWTWLLCCLKSQVLAGSEMRKVQDYCISQCALTDEYGAVVKSW